MKSAIVDYVTEEVWRQGHDIMEPDGLIRTSWMLEAWTTAMGWAGELNIDQIIELGKLVEQDKNKMGIRKVPVWVGSRECPNPGSLRRMLIQFLAEQHELAPLEAYRKFEFIHPFIDGNGRTGKIILNYLNKSLHDPIFPPRDFWGTSIRNP